MVSMAHRPAGRPAARFRAMIYGEPPDPPATARLIEVLAHAARAHPAAA
jgi:hypothetical protein